MQPGVAPVALYYCAVSTGGETVAAITSRQDNGCGTPTHSS